MDPTNHVLRSVTQFSANSSHRVIQADRGE
jgi:hypothetical protein